MIDLMTMTFYVQRTPDGLIHVQNMVSVYEGQHHVHTPAGFEKWKADTEKKMSGEFVQLKGGPCDCGLEAGQARSREGNVTNLSNPEWV